MSQYNKISHKCHFTTVLIDLCPLGALESSRLELEQAKLLMIQTAN